MSAAFATTPATTPAGAPSAAGPALSDAQLDVYRSTGYLTLHRVLDAALMQRLIEATQRLWEAGRVLQQKTAHYDLAADHGEERPRIRRISSPTELDDVFVELAFDSKSTRRRTRSRTPRP
jgi:hypothetical protein